MSLNCGHVYCQVSKVYISIEPSAIGNKIANNLIKPFNYILLNFLNSIAWKAGKLIAKRRKSHTHVLIVVPKLLVAYEVYIWITLLLLSFEMQTKK